MPYADIHRRQNSYIDPSFLPPGVIIRDPRNMSLQNVKATLSKISERQKAMPLSKVFRFKNVASSRKANGSLSPAIYPGDLDPAEAAALLQEKERTKRRRAPRRKATWPAVSAATVNENDLDGLLTMPVSSVPIMFGLRLMAGRRRTIAKPRHTLCHLRKWRMFTRSVVSDHMLTVRPIKSGFRQRRPQHYLI